MMSKFTPLPQINVASPCHENWSEMTGSEQSRFCQQCEKSVLNLTEMTNDEVREVVTSGESICVRMRRQPDGTIVTRDTAKARQSGWFRRHMNAIATSVAASLALVGCSRDNTVSSPISAPEPTPVVDETEIIMGDICVELPPEEQLQTAEGDGSTLMMGMVAPTMEE